MRRVRLGCVVAGLGLMLCWPARPASALSELDVPLGHWSSEFATRLGLRAVEVPYSLAMRWRNRRYDTHPSASHRVGVPVVIAAAVA